MQIIADQEISCLRWRFFSCPEMVQDSAFFFFFFLQVLGYVPEEVDCPELGVVTKWEIFEALVIAPLKTVTEVDWRDFFPAFKWVPNKSVEDNIKAVERRRTLIIKGLIKDQRRRLKNQPEVLLSRNLLDSKL